VALFLAVTCALGITAPVASVTIPLTLALLDWLKAPIDSETTNAAAKPRHLMDIFPMDIFPLLIQIAF
jgi:hypothetical protein